MAKQFLRHEDFVYALVDHPKATEEVMGVIDDSCDGPCEELAASGRLEFLTFGENIAIACLSHHHSERYDLPWYKKTIPSAARRPASSPVSTSTGRRH